MQHQHHEHGNEKASMKNLEKAKAHGCADRCPGCAGFFRSLLNKEARGQYVLMNGGAENAAKIINGKAEAMIEANPKGAKVFGESTAAAFDKFLKAAGISGGLQDPILGLETVEKNQSAVEKATFKYIAASKGKHWD
ncbi:MAG: hypothetical protein AB7U85_07600 [Alphaproteobacteria bacterium]